MIHPHVSAIVLGVSEMHSILHVLGTLVVLPYLLLAAAFLLMSDVARTRGLFEIMAVVANHANWILRWGIYGLPVVMLALLVAGLIPSWQRGSTAVLFLVALGSLAVIGLLHSGKLELGHYVFLLPCVAVVAVSAWLFIRSGTPALGESMPATVQQESGTNP